MVRKKGNVADGAFQIREEFVRWDNVKTAHDLVDDMEVARMLLDCYDLVGGSFLVWSDQAKLAPPPLYVTLRLQHVTPEGWEVLQEIKSLGGWRQDKDGDEKKSRRKQAQTQVQRIKQEPRYDDEVEVDFDTYGFKFESSDDSYESEEDDEKDSDYDPGQEYNPAYEEIGRKKSKKRPVRQFGRKRSVISYAEHAETIATTSTKQEMKEEDEQDEGRAEEGDSVEQKSTRKTKKKTEKGTKKRRPAKERQPKQPKNWGRYAKTMKVFRCKYCNEVTVDLLCDLISHYDEHHKPPVETSEESARVPQGPTQGIEGMSAESSQVPEGAEGMESKPAMNQEFQLEPKPDMNPGFQLEPKPGLDQGLQVEPNLNMNEEFQVQPNPDVNQGLQLEPNQGSQPEDDSVPKGAKTVKPNANKEHEFVLERDAIILYRCLEPTCNELLENKDDHRKLHDQNRKEMVCHICGKVLKTKDSHRIHMGIHDAKARGVKITCKICGKSFPKAETLRSHMRFHSKTRPHQCETCGKGFKTNWHLRRHRLIHVEAKPMVCPYCGKGFNNESNYRGHLRIHTGEKPYKCDICQAAFTHNVSLKSHKKSAHGIDMWQVPVKRFEEVNDEIIQACLTASIAEKTEGNPDDDDEDKELKAATSSVTDLLNKKTEETIAHELALLQDIPDLSDSTEQMHSVKDARKDIPSSSGIRHHRNFKSRVTATHSELTPMQHGENKVIVHPAFMFPSGDQHQSSSLIPPYPPLVHPSQQIPSSAGGHLLPIHSRATPYDIDAVMREIQSAAHQDYADASRRTFTKL